MKNLKKRASESQIYLHQKHEKIFSHDLIQKTTIFNRNGKYENIYVILVDKMCYY
jgi:hypothetical protein